MRRVYYTKTKSPERKKLEQQALMALRTAKENIGETLLEKVRSAIETHPQGDAYIKAMIEEQPDENGMIKINKARTLDVVLQFARLCPDKAAMCKALAQRAFS